MLLGLLIIVINLLRYVGVMGLWVCAALLVGSGLTEESFLIVSLGTIWLALAAERTLSLWEMPWL